MSRLDNLLGELKKRRVYRVAGGYPWLTRPLPLWNLLSEAKELKLFDGVGHLPPAELRIRRSAISSIATWPADAGPRLAVPVRSGA
jgi:hypothetical protein